MGVREWGWERESVGREREREWGVREGGSVGCERVGWERDRESGVKESGV